MFPGRARRADGGVGSSSSSSSNAVSLPTRASLTRMCSHTKHHDAAWLGLAPWSHAAKRCMASVPETHYDRCSFALRYRIALPTPVPYVPYVPSHSAERLHWSIDFAGSATVFTPDADSLTAPNRPADGQWIAILWWARYDLQVERDRSRHASIDRRSSDQMPDVDREERPCQRPCPGVSLLYQALALDIDSFAFRFASSPRSPINHPH